MERGFYIHIGAQHPEIDSVSKAFFDRGWQGVHVEPVPHYANLLREARPGDRVIVIVRDGGLCFIDFGSD